jgi:hypothetical protein
MSRKETYDGETKSGKEDEHLRRLREFKKRQKSGLFSKDFDEEARYFVDHQLKKIGKATSRIPFRARTIDQRRQREWSDALENMPNRCVDLDDENCKNRSDCFLSAYTRDNEGNLTRDMDLEGEDGIERFVCKNIHKNISRHDDMPFQELKKRKNKERIISMRRNKMNDPKNILKRKLSDKVNLALYNGGGGYFGTYNKKEMPLDNTLKLDFVQKSKTISKSKRKIHGNKSRRKMLRNKSRRKMLGNKTKRRITRRKSNRGETRRMTKVNPR